MSDQDIVDFVSTPITPQQASPTPCRTRTSWTSSTSTRTIPTWRRSSARRPYRWGPTTIARHWWLCSAGATRNMRTMLVLPMPVLFRRPVARPRVRPEFITTRSWGGRRRHESLLGRRRSVLGKNRSWAAAAVAWQPQVQAWPAAQQRWGTVRRKRMATVPRRPVLPVVPPPGSVVGTNPRRNLRRGRRDNEKMRQQMSKVVRGYASVSRSLLAPMQIIPVGPVSEVLKRVLHGTRVFGGPVFRRFGRLISVSGSSLLV